MKSLKTFLKEKENNFIMLSFAFLFAILFVSMMLNFIVDNVVSNENESKGTFLSVMQISFVVLVLAAVVLYQILSLSEAQGDRMFVVLLDLFAAIVLVLIFSPTYVNVFLIVKAMYLVLGVSAVTYLLYGLFADTNIKKNFINFAKVLKLDLIIMAFVIALHCLSMLVGTGSPDPETALPTTYMFFGSALLLLIMTNLMLVKKNVFIKIVTVLMFASSFIAGISHIGVFGMIDFLYDTSLNFVLAGIFGLSFLILICSSIFKVGTHNKKPEAKLYIKQAVFAASGAVMFIMFIDGFLDEGFNQTLLTVMYAVSVVLAVALAVYMIITSKYEEQFVMVPDAAEGVATDVAPAVEVREIKSETEQAAEEVKQEIEEIAEEAVEEVKEQTEEAAEQVEEQTETAEIYQEAEEVKQETEQAAEDIKQEAEKEEDNLIVAQQEKENKKKK
jgi:ABC-type multidrug transport system fused ATPase/permease subunit